MTTVPFASGAPTHQPLSSTPSDERNVTSSEVSCNEAGVSPAFSLSGNWKRRVVARPARNQGTQPKAKRTKPRATARATRLSQIFFRIRSRLSCGGTAHDTGPREKKPGERSARHDGPRLGPLGADRSGVLSPRRLLRSPFLHSTFGTLTVSRLSVRLSPARNELSSRRAGQVRPHCRQTVGTWAWPPGPPGEPAPIARPSGAQRGSVRRGTSQGARVSGS
jgi:hypothetical protein